METLFTPELLRYLASLGVGGIIAGVMFAVYRQDAKRWAEQWRGQSDALLAVVKDNTKAMTQNTDVIRALISRLNQIEDRS